MENRPDSGPSFLWTPILTVLFSALIVSTTASFFAARLDRDEVRQPIAFNHARHVGEQKIECSTCHEYYETHAFSGLPTVDTCAMCHSEAIGESVEEKKLVELIRDGQPLVWQSLFRQPAHVFYSHRRHVVQAKLECEQCHGRFAETTSPPVRVARLTMTDCVECHTARGVAADCTTCHR